MSYRNSRLPHAFREEISKILLRELRDQIPGLPTVTEVKVPTDLSEARVYVSVFGSPELQKEVLAKLNEQAGYVRKLIGQRLRIRRSPELRFVFDETIEHGDRMMQIFAEIGKELPPADSPAEPRAPDQGETEAAG
jgi:ribosome-binding factor A